MKNNADYIINQFDMYCDSPTNIISYEQLPAEIIYHSIAKTLNISTSESDKIQLLVINSLGQIVIEESFKRLYSTSLEGLSNGLYVIKIQNEYGLVKTTKILKE